MNDRDFWLLIRRALLMIVKAIEVRWNGKPMPPLSEIDIKPIVTD